MMMSSEQGAPPPGRLQPDMLDGRARWVVFLVLASFGLLTIASYASASRWSATQWLFDYSHGFMRRGLIGTLVGTPSSTEVFLGGVVISAVVVLAAAALLTVAVVRGAQFDRRRSALAIALVGSAGGFPFIAASSGRLEQVSVLLALASGVAVWRSRHGALAAAALGCLAALVHEASVVLFWPWLAALHWHRHQRVPGSMAVLLLPALAVLGMAFAEPQLPYEQLLVELGVGTDIDPHPDSVGVLYRDLGDNLAYTWGLLTSAQVIKLPASALAAAPLLVVSCWAVWPQWREHRWLLIASLLPIGLSVVAIDFGRWFAVASVLAAATALVVGSRRAPRQLAIGAGLVLLASIASGPTDAWGFDGVTSLVLRLLG